MKCIRLMTMAALALLFSMRSSNAVTDPADYQYVVRVNYILTINHTNHFEKVLIDTRDIIEAVAEDVGYTNSLSDLELVVNLLSPSEFGLYVAHKETGVVLGGSNFAEFEVGGFSMIERNLSGTFVTKVIIDAYVIDFILGRVDSDFLESFYLGQLFSKLLLYDIPDLEHPVLTMTGLLEGAIYGSDPLIMIRGTIITVKRFKPTNPSP